MRQYQLVITFANGAQGSVSFETHREAVQAAECSSANPDVVSIALYWQGRQLQLFKRNSGMSEHSPSIAMRVA